MTAIESSGRRPAPAVPPRGEAGREVFRRGLALVEVVALILMIGAGLAAWSVGIVTRWYDYDEVQRAHSAWLASQGLRPYGDFFECHPPYFVLLAPVVRAFPDPGAMLLALRLVAAAGNLLFLGGLAALGQASVAPGGGRRWVWLGLAVVACSPPILDFLVEFRIDGWGYALAAWSIVRYRRLPRGGYRNFELGALTGIASLLFCPKLVLLPPLIVLFDQVGAWPSLRGILRDGAAYLVGFGLAAALFGLYLLVNRIEFGRMVLLLGRYHALSNANASFGYGLLRQIVAFWPLTLLVVAGVVGWAVDCLRRKRPMGPYEPALAIWLVMQALLVAYPYKQYYAPWFLFAAHFLVYLGPALSASALLKGARAAVLVLACAVIVLAAGWIARGWANTGGAGSDQVVLRWMDRVTAPEDRVVGSPPYHPITRHDTFFLWFNTWDSKTPRRNDLPGLGARASDIEGSTATDWTVFFGAPPDGFDSERILAALPALRSFATEDRYRAELEAHPPALVTLGSDTFLVNYTSGQRTALNRFLRRRGYRIVRVRSAWLALRPDRFEDARRNGLTR